MEESGKFFGVYGEAIDEKGNVKYESENGFPERWTEGECREWIYDDANASVHVGRYNALVVIEHPSERVAHRRKLDEVPACSQ